MAVSMLALVPLAVCAVEPAGGVLVMKGRRYPAVEAGKSGAVVTHQTKQQKRSVVDPPGQRGEFPERSDVPLCNADGAVALAFPLAGAKPKVVLAARDDEQCAGAAMDALRLVRLGGEPAAIACEYPYNLAWGCTVESPFVKAAGFGFAKSTNDVAEAAGFAAFGDTLFAVAVGRSGNVVGFVVAGAAAKKDLLETLPGDFERKGMQVRVEAKSASEALVTIVPAAGKALALTMNGEGKRVGRMKSVAAPPPAGFVVERAGKSPPRIVGVKGLNEAAGVFSPSAAGGWLAWSEGLRKDTRVRAARFDASARAIAGAPVEVSPAGREAGYVSLAASGEHVVIAWDQKDESGKEWEVRAGELVCK